MSMLTVDANVWVAAFDPADIHHQQSLAFFSRTARLRMQLHAPTFLLVETACALRRRMDDPGAGDVIQRKLREHPLLVLVHVDDALISAAINTGTQNRLRGADALYAATAAMMNAPLISWDAELVQRVDAQTPSAWMESNT